MFNNFKDGQLPRRLEKEVPVVVKEIILKIQKVK